MANPLTTTDARVAPYADSAYQYDSQQRITQVALAGDGRNEGSGTGPGTFTYRYVPSMNPAGFNCW